MKAGLTELSNQFGPKCVCVAAVYINHQSINPHLYVYSFISICQTYPYAISIFIHIHPYIISIFLFIQPHPPFAVQEFARLQGPCAASFEPPLAAAALSPRDLPSAHFASAAARPVPRDGGGWWLMWRSNAIINDVVYPRCVGYCRIIYDSHDVFVFRFIGCRYQMCSMVSSKWIYIIYRFHL